MVVTIVVEEAEGTKMLLSILKPNSRITIMATANDLIVKSMDFFILLLGARLSSKSVNDEE